MAEGRGSGSPPAAILPRSPPRRRSKLSERNRLPAEVEIAVREITSLQEELQSLGGLESVSRCCKEVHEFVVTNTDPLVPVTKKKHQSSSTWKWLRAKLCCSWICCCCPCRPERQSCNRHQHRKSCCCNCEGVLYCGVQCSGCSCGCIQSSCPDCMNVCHCLRCTKPSCISNCLC